MQNCRRWRNSSLKRIAPMRGSQHGTERVPMGTLPSLPDMQRSVLGALLPRVADAPTAGAAGLPADSAATAAGALALLKSAHGPSAAQRLQIYRHNLFESLAGALG